MANSDLALTPRDITRTIFKRWRSIFSILLAATLICLLVCLLMPPVYQAESTLFVNRTNLDTEKLNVSDEPPSISSSIRQLNQQDEINTEIALLKSRDLITKVVDDVKLTQQQLDQVPDYRRYVRMAYKGTKQFVSTAWNETKYFLHLSRRPTPEEIRMREYERLVNDVAQALRVEQINNSDVVMVAFRCSDPMLAQRMSRAFCSGAVAWHMDIRQQAGTLPFYQEQIQDTRTKLEKIERELADTRGKYNLISADHQIDLLLQYQLQATGQLNQAQAQQAALNASIVNLNKTLAKEPAEITLTRNTEISPLWQFLTVKLSDLKLERSSQRAKFSDQAREVKNLDQVLREGEQYLANTPEKIAKGEQVGVNELHQKLRETMLTNTAELSAETAKVDVLKKQIAGYKQTLQEINDQLFRIKVMERQKDSLESTYNLYLKNAELARLASERQHARLANLIAVQHAGLPISPQRPRMLLYMLLAVAGGLVLGTAWAFINEMTDTTYWNPNELTQAINIPVLGSLERI